VASPTRRQALQGALATGLTLPVLGWSGIGRAQGNSGPSNIAVNRLTDQLHVLTAGGINMLARTDNDGVLLVDGGSSITSPALLDVTTAISGGAPIHTLFNSHWHPEHTGSNGAASAQGATIIAQENTRLWLTTDIVYPWDESQRFDPLPKSAQPNSTFYDTGELDSGVQYGYLRHAAHTDGDLYVFFRDENVLAVGDAVYGEGWPLVDWWTGGWIGGIVGGLELILSLMNVDTQVVPARGPVLGITDIQDQFGMYNTIYTRLQTMLNDGRGPDEAVAAMPTAEFDAERGPPDEFVRRSFESLWAYLSPDA
jgi:glyoxylase-like metal-dependent hydrolase (beta-lactamase superfamily II)